MKFRARPPEAAVAYLEQKTVGGRFSFDHRDVWREEHLNAFVVAKATQADVLADIHGDLVKAIDEGWSQERFAKELRPKLEAKGWWGRREQVDPLTGEVRQVQLGSPRRLKVIFETNMRQAHMAAQWQRLWATREAFPLLRYRHIDAQKHPRIQHARWGGTILPIEHPWWTTHFPMNGWGCKCSVVPERRGEITSDKALDARGDNDLVPWRNRRTGQTGVSPRGIDPGFAYNVGQARRTALTPPASPEPVRPSVLPQERVPRALPPTPLLRPLPGDVRVRPDLDGESDPAEVFEAFSRVLGLGEGEVFTDAAQVPLVISKRMFEAHDPGGVSISSKRGLGRRAPLAEILAAVLRDPDEIWHAIQVFETGTRVVRNVIGRFDAAEAGREWFLLTFVEGGARGWEATTAFGPGAANDLRAALTYINKNARYGTLVYRRQ